MPNSARVEVIEGVPVRGKLTRVRLLVKTAPTGGATKARVIITAHSFSNNSDGFTALKSADAQRFVVFDSDANGTPSITVTAVGVAFDRIFNGEVFYENQDDVGDGFTTGWTVATESKRPRLYAYVELDGAPGTVEMRVEIDTAEAA